MNILIVDDEVLVRTKLKSLIEIEIPQIQQEIEFNLCGEASNGAEALEKIEKLYPDLIISDMKMPVMDGLTLCRICREKYPECAFLVLSNYDDFSYVKETLLLGAGEYLLKHSLDAKNLLLALEKIYKEERIGEKECSATGIAALKEDAVRNLLGGVYTHERQVGLDIRNLDMNISIHRVVPVMMWIREYEDGEFKMNNTLSFSVKNIVNEILADQKNGIICHANREKYAILLGYEEIRSEQKIRELLLFSLNRIRFCMNHFLGMSVSFIVGRIQPSVLTVGEEYHILETEFQNSFYQENDVWISEMEMNKTRKKEEIIFSTEDEKNLIYELTSGNQENAKVLLESILDRIEKNKPSETIYKMLLVRILDCLKKAAEQSAIKADDLFQGEVLEEKILKLQSFHKIKKDLDQICTIFFEEKNKKIQVSSGYMQKAVAYIHQHFRENISQTEVAEHVGISSVYLSVLFKNEMEENFPSYLKSVRLKEAERLIEKGNTNLKEVADESGFKDYVYFLKCFKKQYSCTPKEFIKRLKR